MNLHEWINEWVLVAANQRNKRCEWMNEWLKPIVGDDQKRGKTCLLHWGFIIPASQPNDCINKLLWMEDVRPKRQPCEIERKLRQRFLPLLLNHLASDTQQTIVILYTQFIWTMRKLQANPQSSFCLPHLLKSPLCHHSNCI